MLKATNQTGNLQSNKCNLPCEPFLVLRRSRAQESNFWTPGVSVIELRRAAEAMSAAVRGEAPDGGSRLRRAAMAGAHQIQIAPWKPTLRLSLSPPPRTSDTS